MFEPRMTKILLLAANPNDSVRLRLDIEMREIDQAIRTADFGAQIEVVSKAAVRLRDLADYLDIYHPDIVHFSGHTNQSTEIILENESGASRPVSKENLIDIFSRFTGQIKCVVLNSCYSEAQANAIAEHIDCVVGMLDQITDESAIDFSREFYRQLAMGKDITTAFKQGRAQIGQREDLARLLAFHANPSQITFISRRKDRLLMGIRYVLWLIIAAPIFATLIILISNEFFRSLDFFTDETLALLVLSIAYFAGVIWSTFGVKLLLSRT